MSKVLLVLATTPVAQPAGKTFGGSYLFKVGSAPAQIVTTTQATFDGINDGDVGSVESLDSTGAPMGDQVTVTISIPAASPSPAPAPAPAPDATTYPAPSTLTFQILS